MNFDVESASLKALEAEFARLANGRTVVFEAFKSARSNLDDKITEFSMIYGKIEVIEAIATELVGNPEDDPDADPEPDGSPGDSPYSSDVFDLVDGLTTIGGAAGSVGSFALLGYSINRVNKLKKAAAAAQTAATATGEAAEAAAGRAAAKARSAAEKANAAATGAADDAAKAAAKAKKAAEKATKAAASAATKAASAASKAADAAEAAAKATVTWPKLKIAGGLVGAGLSGLGVALIIRDAAERREFYSENIPIYEAWYADMRETTTTFNTSTAELEASLQNLQDELEYETREAMKDELGQSVGDVAEFMSRYTAMTKMLCNNLGVDDIVDYTGFPEEFVRKRLTQIVGDPDAGIPPDPSICANVA